MEVAFAATETFDLFELRRETSARNHRKSCPAIPRRTDRSDEYFFLTA